MAMKTARNVVRIRWTRDPKSPVPDALALRREEGERVFCTRTGLDPYTLEPPDARNERGPVDRRPRSLLALLLAVALDREVATRKARRTGTIRTQHSGRPQLGIELRQLLRLTVETLDGPANAALFLWINGLDSSRAHVTRATGPEDDGRDTREAYTLLTKRLDVIAKTAAKELPKLTEISIGVDVEAAA
jgi:hypothetical protein